MDIKAKISIPDNWGPRAKCPICNKHGLRVLHIHGTPDLMVCDNCNTNFVVEDGGSHIRIVILPPMLQSHANLKDKWMTFEEVGDYIKRFIDRNKTSAESAASIKPTVHLPNDSASQGKPALDTPEWVDTDECNEDDLDPDLKKKVLDLYKLGNSPERIKMIVLQTNDFSAECIDAAIHYVKSIDDQKKKKQTRGLLIAGIITIVCLLSFISALFIWSFFRNNSGSMQIVPESMLSFASVNISWLITN